MALNKFVADELLKKGMPCCTSNEQVVVLGSIRLQPSRRVRHAIGQTTRRLKVANRSLQHDVMLQAVQNHTPDLLIVDEIGSAFCLCKIYLNELRSKAVSSGLVWD